MAKPCATGKATAKQPAPRKGGGVAMPMMAGASGMKDASKMNPHERRGYVRHNMPK